MDFYFKIIFYIVLVFSAIVHEIMHGLVAEHYGDDTARRAGRITFNPIKHIDLFYTIIMPGLLALAGSPIIIGGAKPVPVNIARLRDPRKHGVLVSLAGPFSNLVLAVICAIPVSLGILPEVGQQLFVIGVLANVALFVFNMLPVPPLDGSKLIFYFLPSRLWGRWFHFERYGFFLLLIVLYYTPVFTYLFSLVLNIFTFVFPALRVLYI